MRTSRHGRTALLAGTSLLVCTLALALPAGAATLYVDAGNTTGIEDGTATHPFSAIQAAVTAAASGDTVRVAAGIYNEDIVVDGTGVSLLGEDPATTAIRGFSSVVEAKGSFVPGKNRVEIAGFTITGGGSAGVLFNSATVAGSVHNCIVVVNNRGVYVASGSKANLYNNVIVGSSAAGVVAVEASVVSASGNVFTNNANAIYTASSSVVSSSYNTLFGNSTDIYCVRDRVTISGTVCTSYTASTNDTTGADPLFVDAATGDYHLQASSPCINAGSPLALDNDPDGTRNDQGAYGGPGAAGFWPRPLGGPVVTEVTVTPHDVPAGGTIQVKAKGKVR